MNDTTTLEEDAALNEAARMVLAEMRANPGSELSLLVQAFVECGKAAAVQGFETGRAAERSECAGVVRMTPLYGEGTDALRERIASAIEARKC